MGRSMMLLVYAVCLSAMAFESVHAQRKSKADIARERRLKEMSEAAARRRLIKQAKTDEHAFFKAHVKGRYVVSRKGLHDASSAVAISGYVVQTIKGAGVMVDPRVFNANKVRFDPWVFLRIEKDSGLVDDEYVTWRGVEDGVFEYTTVLGARKRLAAYVQAYPISFSMFQGLKERGLKFPELLRE